MFEDNNGGAGAPLDNLTEDDIVLCDYDEVLSKRLKMSFYNECLDERRTVIVCLDPRGLLKGKVLQLLPSKRSENATKES